MARDKKFRNGPNMNAVGWTQASVSAIKSPELEVKAERVSATPPIEETSPIVMAKTGPCNLIDDEGIWKAVT